MRKTRSHPTATELYDLVRRRLPRISLGTVYRNLDQLAECGEINRLEVGRLTRFDGDTHPHCHVRCVRCGRVDDVHDIPPDAVKINVQRLGGYRIIDAPMEFLGVCPTCDADDLPFPDRSTTTQ
ncbi:MAG: transcriptional repressor [Phycisphaerales bacterium]|nr:transcriptional repressor [Phycisphaerales bacterium]